MPPRIVLTIGTFDGVHRGHQKLLEEARRRADATGGRVKAVAFTEPPRLFFAPSTGPSLLTTPEEKSFWLRRFGADEVVPLVFDGGMASVSVREFIDRFVRRRWGADEVVVGFNFKFGRARSGDVAVLAREGRSLGLGVRVVSPVTWRGKVVSSGRIRPLVAEGDISAAERLLGHPYIVEGSVVRGKGIGRRWGYPTANLGVADSKILPLGVFATEVILPTGLSRRGLLNVGFRPTVDRASKKRSVEVHVLDFSGDLVGRSLRLRFLKKIRDEKRFPSASELVRQIGRDEQCARA